MAEKINLAVIKTTINEESKKSAVS